MMHMRFEGGDQWKSTISPEFIVRGKGCRTCHGRGYTVAHYRDEVRDEETYYTCGDCLNQAQRQEFRTMFAQEKHLSPRKKWLIGE